MFRASAVPTSFAVRARLSHPGSPHPLQPCRGQYSFPPQPPEYRPPDEPQEWRQQLPKRLPLVLRPGRLGRDRKRHTQTGFVPWLSERTLRPSPPLPDPATLSESDQTPRLLLCVIGFSYQPERVIQPADRRQRFDNPTCQSSAVNILNLPQRAERLLNQRGISGRTTFVWINDRRIPDRRRLDHPQKAQRSIRITPSAERGRQTPVATISVRLFRSGVHLRQNLVEQIFEPKPFADDDQGSCFSAARFPCRPQRSIPVLGGDPRVEHTHREALNGLHTRFTCFQDRSRSASIIHGLSESVPHPFRHNPIPHPPVN